MSVLLGEGEVLDARDVMFHSNELEDELQNEGYDKYVQVLLCANYRQNTADYNGPTVEKSVQK